ncbi:MAG: hypothetical protein H6978_10540 [Gammaproteobacteria bacterium]|nr:hypothetical protein [Gammaproteobacteria bacterium]
MTRMIPRLFLLALWLGFSAPASSHHSIVEFDYTHAYAVTGTIKELQWTNPHSWVQMLVENSAGESIEFGFELGAPVFNIRMGWRKDSVKPGDEVTVVFCPAKNGAPRGTLMYIYLPSGERLSGIAPRIYSGKAFDAPSEVPPSPILAGAD